MEMSKQQCEIVLRHQPAI